VLGGRLRRSDGLAGGPSLLQRGGASAAAIQQAAVAAPATRQNELRGRLCRSGRTCGDRNVAEQSPNCEPGRQLSGLQDAGIGVDVHLR